MGAAHVFQYRRTDPVTYLREEEYADNAIIYGETPKFTSGTDEAVWQIKLVSFENGEVVTTFADHGKYNNVWDDRASYFPQLPITGPGFPADNITVSTTPGLTGPGTHYPVTINNLTWTALPTQASQQVIGIFNDTGEKIKVNFSDKGPGNFIGTPVAYQTAKAYDVQNSVVIWAMSENPVAVDLDVEIISG